MLMFSSAEMPVSWKLYLIMLLLLAAFACAEVQESLKLAGSSDWT
jgi:hypothetical protein